MQLGPKAVDRVFGGPGTDTAVLDFVTGTITPLDKLTDASVEIKI